MAFALVKLLLIFFSPFYWLLVDDITLPGNDPGVNHSTEGTSGYDLIYSELDVKELSHKQQMTESKRAASTAPVILEQGKHFILELFL